jgi:hypothetical protein
LGHVNGNGAAGQYGNFPWPAILCLHGRNKQYGYGTGYGIPKDLFHKSVFAYMGIKKQEVWLPAF